MKAIRKSDGKEIDVRLYHSEEYIETEADSGSLGVRVYTAEALILEEPFDWSTFRREAAKECLQMYHRRQTNGQPRKLSPRHWILPMNSLSN